MVEISDTSNNPLKFLMKSSYNVTKDIASVTYDQMIAPILRPILIWRPSEMLSDVSEYSLPFKDQSQCCVNYIKRQIRMSVLKNEKESGLLSYSINPRKAWLLDMSKVNIDKVVEDVNIWLETMCEHAGYPKSIIYRQGDSLKSRLNHGNHFVVRYV